MSDLATSSRLPFSEAVSCNGMLYISGQIGIDPTMNRLQSGGFEAEADRVMKNLGRVLEQKGLGYEHLVSVTIYLKTMENYGTINLVYSKYFTGVFPARVCIAVSELPLKANLEIAAIAQIRPPAAEKIPYYHVDVFSDKRFSGNGLTVFPESQGLSKAAMQAITVEMRQFESIFLRHRQGDIFEANVFTMEEELDFAGHPSLGAAATLHELYKPAADEAEWILAFPAKNVSVKTHRKPYGFEAIMNQGPATFGQVLTDDESRYFLQALGIRKEDLNVAWPLQIVSTGLPYLLIPMQRNALKARILVTDLNEKLSRVGAKFLGILEVPSRSIRTWDNLGLVEDIATGSLAGPAAAWLVRYGLCAANEPITIRQGANLGRSSLLYSNVLHTGDVLVSGAVVSIADGQLTTSSPTPSAGSSPDWSRLP